MYYTIKDALICTGATEKRVRGIIRQFVKPHIVRRGELLLTAQDLQRVQVEAARIAAKKEGKL
jgi:hypothetical protein